MAAHRAPTSVLARAEAPLALARRPVPLTPFIGRAAERRALAAAVGANRLVTATGPGGVGKTRLCLAMADDLIGGYADGIAFVDLVAVTEDSMVVAAMADAVGSPEQTGVSRRHSLATTLADRDLLMIVDNCEHLLVGARNAIDDLLADCPTVQVLATSRTRLLLAGETVFPLPGLSIEQGDAEALFTARLAASGVAESLTDADSETVRAICRRLDGMALAIELAAARVPSVGLDGLRRALDESHDLLARGHRTGDRHGSLRAAIDWSYHLLSPDEQAVLRAVSAFAAPFDLDAAGALLGRPPSDLLEVLGRLVDWSLVTLRPGRPTRYRVLETIRQYAGERSAELDELDDIRHRHRRWCHSVLDDLLARAPGDDAWCYEVDHILDDARAALAWSAATDGGDGSGDDRTARAEAGALADVLAAVAFVRGRPGEAQLRYEQAAALALTAAERHQALYRAARAALMRYIGDDAVALGDRAVTAALEAGDGEKAGMYLAHIVTWRHRHVGTMTIGITPGETEAILARALELGGRSSNVQAAAAVARAFNTEDDVIDRLGQARAAVGASGATGDPLLHDAALDLLCAAQLEAAELEAAEETVQERLARLAAVPLDVTSAMDHADAWLMGAHVDLAAGRLARARHHADALAALPFLREEPHVGLARRIEVDALAGDVDQVVELAEAFHAGWVRAGRPRVNNFGPPAYAVAMVHGLRRDASARQRWVQIARDVSRSPDAVDHPLHVWPQALDALLDLDLGAPDRALARLPHDADEVPLFCRWHQQLWLPWYAAAWAEASALTGATDLDHRLARAATVARGNGIAELIVERAALLRDGSPATVGRQTELAAQAGRFEAMGCPYQARRTRELAGDPSAGTEPAPTPRPAALSSLSPREHEVLALVAAGHSNPQIAEALYISRKTAEHHVSNILTKLGASTRAEAAAMAGRAGLDGDGPSNG